MKNTIYIKRCYYVLDILITLIYSVYGICVPILEKVLRASDLN